MARYLLDTHVIVQIGNADGLESLPLKIRKILQDTDAELLLSVASAIEIAIKNQIGKLELSWQEFAAICASASISSYPLRQRHAENLSNLPLHHKDPFDRLIIATALSDDLLLISSDQQFRKYKGLRIYW